LFFAVEGGGLEEFEVIGWMSFVLKEKSKRIKGVIKEWNMGS